MKESREFLVDFALEIFACQQSFKTGAQECDRTFQLMRSVSRVPCRSFQFFTSRGERGFDAFSLFPIFFRVQRQLLDRHCEAGCDEAACYEPAEQKKHARAANLPAEPMQLSHRISEWINADFVRWREK